MKEPCVLIPLRLASKRLNRKVLLKIGDLPLFVRIYYNIKDHFQTYVTTADKEIIRVCKDYDIPYIESSSEPRNGSERVAEAVKKGHLKSKVIIDLQGDEVDADTGLIEGVYNTLIKKGAEVTTAVMPIKSSELRERDAVKTVLNRFGECIYFTRSPIPCFRYRSNLNPSVFRHIGIYCYKRDTLFRYASLKPTYLEETESLEQMRLIENGIRIYAFITEKEYRKIDNIRDLQKIRREDGFKKEE